VAVLAHHHEQQPSFVSHWLLGIPQSEKEKAVEKEKERAREERRQKEALA
jgi:hypothetical protein